MAATMLVLVWLIRWLADLMSLKMASVCIKEGTQFSSGATVAAVHSDEWARVSTRKRVPLEGLIHVQHPVGEEGLCPLSSAQPFCLAPSPSPLPSVWATLVPSTLIFLGGILKPHQSWFSFFTPQQVLVVPSPLILLGGTFKRHHHLYPPTSPGDTNTFFWVDLQAPAAGSHLKQSCWHVKVFVVVSMRGGLAPAAV